MTGMPTITRPAIGTIHRFGYQSCTYGTRYEVTEHSPDDKYGYTAVILEPDDQTLDAVQEQNAGRYGWDDPGAELDRLLAWVGDTVRMTCKPGPCPF